LLQSTVPGARDQPHRVVARSGHFIQEHAAAELVAVIAEFAKTLPRP
jgi:hypothetical protein